MLLKNHYVYVFKHPETNQIIYIGKSSANHRRFTDHLKHLKSGKYIRHPFKCKLQSLYTSGISYEQLLSCFHIIQSDLAEEDAYRLEAELISNIGLCNLLNIAPGGRYNGDTFTQNPNKEIIRNKYKKRIPWNKGKRGVLKANKTSFKPGPRIKFILTSPHGKTYNILGVPNLCKFCENWKRTHKVKSVKDVNWISASAFQMGTTLKGWTVKKESL